MVDQILQMSLPYSENTNKKDNFSQMGSSYLPIENSFEVKDVKEFSKDTSFSNITNKHIYFTNLPTFLTYFSL